MKTFLINLFLFVVFCTSAITAQEGLKPFFVESFSLNEAEISEGMERALSSGYIPFGIDVVGSNAMSVFFIDQSEDVDKYALNYFDDLSNLDHDFSVFLQQNWYPIDISFDGEGFYVLFVYDPNLPQIKGWRIITVPIKGNTDTGIEEAMNELLLTAIDQAGEGKSFRGISRFGNSIAALFLEDQDTPSVNLKIRTYENDGEKPLEGILTALKEGLIPEGVEVDEKLVWLPYY